MRRPPGFNNWTPQKQQEWAEEAGKTIEKFEKEILESAKLNIKHPALKIKPE